jgi:hypothetical protein
MECPSTQAESNQSQVTSMPQPDGVFGHLGQSVHQVNNTDEVV